MKIAGLTFFVIYQIVKKGTKGRGRMTWNECVKVDRKRLGLVKDDAHNRDKCIKEFDNWNRSNTAAVL